MFVVYDLIKAVDFEVTYVSHKPRRIVDQLKTWLEIISFTYTSYRKLFNHFSLNGLSMEGGGTVTQKDLRM